MSVGVCDTEGLEYAALAAYEPAATSTQADDALLPLLLLYLPELHCVQLLAPALGP
jgi:hypothetical protein